METKKCKKCQENKPATLEYFYKSKQTKDGLNSYCKTCRRSSSLVGMKKYQKTEKGKSINKKYQYLWKNKISGVYGIFENDICLYVGESKQINQRISMHKSRYKSTKDVIQKELYENLRQHDHIEFRILEETDNHLEREKYYINKFKPYYNA